MTLCRIAAASLLLAQLAAGSPALCAEGDAVPEPPRIGLVLSGGGIRGAAHIGVLRVLEELDVPVDVIVGTSMGAVVGGLYAAGLPAGELDASLTRVDWVETFRDEPPRRFLSFRRKEDERGVRGKARLGLSRRGVSVPRGVLEGEELTFLFRTLFMPLQPSPDFDELPIPFRAVAADLETGEAVVLGSGDLVTALRASMSIPGVFDPVELDGRLLVDGGIANNLPVEVAQRMGAELLIVVDVSSKPVSREELDSLFAVTNQVIDLMMLETTEEQLALLGPGDVLITPDLRDLTSASFSRSSEIADLGEAAARAVAGRLRELAAARSRPGERPRPSARAEARRLHDVRVVGTSRLVTSRVRSRAGDPLDLDRLHHDLRRLYGLGIFESVDFALEEEPEGTVLEIRTREKSATDSLRFGLELRDDFEGETSFNFRFRHTALLLNRLGGEVRTDLSVGEDQLLRLELYQPLGAEGLFVAPRIEVREENRRLVEEGGTFRFEGWSTGLDLGQAIGGCCEIRLGIERSEGGGLDETRLRLRFAADTLDNIDFPSRGVVATVSFDDELGSDVEGSVLAASVLFARPLGALRVALGGEIGTDLDDGDAGLMPFRLGGFLRLSGYRRDALAGRHMGFGRLVVYRQFFGEGFLGVPIFAGGSLEAGNAWLDRDDAGFDDLLFAGSAFLGVDSPLGPVYLGAGFGEGGRQEYYFLLGLTRLGELRRDRR